MAETLSYRSQLSIEAAPFLVSLPRRRQRLVLDLAEKIARNPFAPRDYQTADEKGRLVENLFRHGFLFSYRVDHATREVLIAEIIRV